MFSVEYVIQMHNQDRCSTAGEHFAQCATVASPCTSLVWRNLMKFRLVLLLVLGLGLMPAAADASLTGFQTFTGPVGLSTDGFGSISQSGTISANVPAGAVVLGAYLYTSTFNNGSLTGVSATLNGNAVVFASLGTNTDACCQLTAARADVTSISWRRSSTAALAALRLRHH